MRLADHSSRGVLPTVMRRFVRSRNLKNEEAMAHWWAGGGHSATGKRIICNYRTFYLETKFLMTDFTHVNNEVPDLKICR